MKNTPIAGGISLLSKLVVDTPFREELVAVFVDDEVVMLTLVELVEDQDVRDNAVASSVVSRPDSNLELRIIVLIHPWGDLSLGRLIHGHLRHSSSCVFATVLFEVLCPMRIVRIALVRDVAATIHDVVSVPRAVWLANSTEVDVGIAVTVGRDPDVVTVLIRHASLGGDVFLVVAALLTLSLDLFESRLESLCARVKVCLGTFELGTRTFVFGLGGVERSLASTEIVLGSLKGGLSGFVSGAS